MVQSVSQYEFIYEYLLDYLSSKGLISLKFPRNRFGDEDSQNEEEEKEEDPPKLNESQPDNSL